MKDTPPKSSIQQSAEDCHRSAVALLPFSVCFAPGIPSFHAPEHLRFAYLEIENPAWVLRLFGLARGLCSTGPGLRRFLPPRAVDMGFVFACSANESAKRFAGDVEAVVGEPLPD